MTTKANFPAAGGSVVVPYGHVVGNEKWRGSEIAQRLQGKIKLIFEDGLGLVDFHLSNKICILYISEADLVAGDDFKRRLVRFRNANSLGGIVIVERTQISDQYFIAVQKLVVLELGMVLLPVANQAEASQLITQLNSESHQSFRHVVIQLGQGFFLLIFIITGLHYRNGYRTLAIAHLLAPCSHRVLCNSYYFLSKHSFLCHLH
uniref:FA core complex associated protein 24 n=1 Tax=Anas zonorhyncha TaxID=75864 RepID=A0A8B9ZVX6_9AVES